MKTTALNKAHCEQGAKMVEFAGYNMPVQYKDGMLKEHEWIRSGNVGLFDVSHMGQVILEGEGVSQFLSTITPTSFINVDNFLAKYTVLTNEDGGIIDDLIVTKLSEEKFFVVINAGCKEKDIAWIKKNMPSKVSLTFLEDRSLVAIQGEKAEQALQELISSGNLSDLPYMNIGYFQLKSGDDVYISRTGYTGEDGFEVSIKNNKVEDFWLELCQNDLVKPIGLGARDSLRLEVGYPLYGHDLDETTSPIEATLGWVITKGHSNFIGSKKIFDHKESGITRKRAGIKLLGRGIAREGSEVRKDGKKIGVLTSGGFSPVLKVSIGQAYINFENYKIGEEVCVVVRDKEIPAIICSSIFVKAKTKSLKK